MTSHCLGDKLRLNPESRFGPQRQPSESRRRLEAALADAFGLSLEETRLIVVGSFNAEPPSQRGLRVHYRDWCAGDHPDQRQQDTETVHSRLRSSHAVIGGNSGEKRKDNVSRNAEQRFYLKSIQPLW